MRFALALLLITCTPAKPTSEQLYPRSSHRIARVPRPAIELPQIQPDDAALDRADLIWPLRREPALEPHAPLGWMYGVESWRSLCEVRRNPRGVDPDEAVAYLTAWCGLRRDDLSILRVQLATLTNAKSSSIASAVRDDLIEILAFDQLPANRALDVLRTSGIAEFWTLDRLSAAYLAVDREADARVVAKEYARGPAWAGGLDCRSLVRVRALLHEPWIRDVIEERNPTEPICQRIAATLDRIDGVRRCPLFGDDPLHEAPCTEFGCSAFDLALTPCGAAAATWHARLTYAYRHWPSLAGNPWVWVEYAHYVGSESAAARVVAAAALENAALTSDCLGEILPAIREFAQTLGDGPAQRYLRELDEARCAKRYSPTLDRPHSR